MAPNPATGSRLGERRVFEELFFSLPQWIQQPTQRFLMSKRTWAQWWTNCVVSPHLGSHHASLWPLPLVYSGYELKYVLKIASCKFQMAMVSADKRSVEQD